MSDSHDVSFPKVEEFIALCEETKDRYLASAHAMLSGLNFIEERGERHPLDQDMIRVIEPRGCDRQRFWMDTLVIEHALAGHKDLFSKNEAGKERGFKYYNYGPAYCEGFETYVLSQFSQEQLDELHAEILTAKKFGLYPLVLMGIENLQPFVAQHQDSPPE